MAGFPELQTLRLQLQPRALLGDVGKAITCGFPNCLMVRTPPVSSFRNFPGPLLDPRSQNTQRWLPPLDFMSSPAPGQLWGNPGLSNTEHETLNGIVLPTPSPSRSSRGLSGREFLWCYIENAVISGEKTIFNLNFYQEVLSPLRILKYPSFHGGAAAIAAETTKEHRQMLTRDAR